MFGLSITRNLITHVLTICHVNITQSTALEQKSFNLRSLSPALCNLPWWKSLQNLCWSAKILQRPSKTRIFKRSLKISWGSSNDLMKILAKIFSKILKDLIRILQDLKRSFSGSSRILKDIARMKDLYKDLWKIFVRILEEIVRIFQGSLKELYKNLWKIFIGKYLLKSFWHDPSLILKEIVGIVQESFKGLFWISMWTSFHNC